MEVAVGPLRLKLRIDRIDATDAGDVLIDYKTGTASHKDWLTERPDEPQLPLYAMITDAPLAAIAFARIRPGKEMGLDGYADAPTASCPSPPRFPSRPSTSRSPSGAASSPNLAEDFHAGDARVAPKSYPKTCQHCAQRLLCRLNPATLGRSSKTTPNTATPTIRRRSMAELFLVDPSNRNDERVSARTRPPRRPTPTSANRPSTSADPGSSRRPPAPARPACSSSATSSCSPTRASRRPTRCSPSPSPTRPPPSCASASSAAWRAPPTTPLRPNEFDRLTQPLARAVLARDRALDWNILAQPDRLNIRTIDSLCAEIARSLPVLSGCGGRQSPVTDAEPLYALAAQRTFLQLGGSDPALERRPAPHPAAPRRQPRRLRGAARRDARPPRSVGRARPARPPRARRRLPRHQHSSPARSARSNRPFAPPSHSSRAASRTICSSASPRPPPRWRTSTATTASPRPSPSARDRDELPGLTADDLAHWRALMHLLVSPSQKTWRRGFNSNHVGFAHHQGRARTPEGAGRRAAASRRSAARHPAASEPCRPRPIPPEQWVVAKALFRILSRALIELKLVFAERGECDFTEVALAAADRPPQRPRPSHDRRRDRGRARRHANDDLLAAALGLRLQHLLVDEMQDTSSSQYELIQMLTQGWDGYSQTVFLVGDPKQSIYLFRQARVERFLHTMRSGTLGDLPLGCLRLTANFRSQAALVEQFNEDFAEIFPDARRRACTPRLGCPSSPPIPCAPPSLHSAGRVWHANLIPAARSNPIENAQAKQTLRRDEALAIRRIIEQWRAKPLPPGRSEPWKIAVLVRSRSHATEIIRAFQDVQRPTRRRADSLPRHRDRRAQGASRGAGPLRPHPRPAASRRPRRVARRAARAVVRLRPRRAAPAHRRRRPHLGRAQPPRRHRRARRPARSRRLPAPRTPLADPPGRHRDGRPHPHRAARRTHLALARRRHLPQRHRAHQRPPLPATPRHDRAADRHRRPRRSSPASSTTSTPRPPSSPTPSTSSPFTNPRASSGTSSSSPRSTASARIDRARLLSWIELDASAHARRRRRGRRGLRGARRSKHPSAHILLAPIRSRGEASRELNAWLDGIRREREAAERKRLLYVACTRAREELHLFASPELNEKGGISPRSGSLLQSFWPAAKAHFDAVAADALPLPTSTSATKTRSTEGLALAATADPAPSHANLLYRLPLDFDPEAHLRARRPLANTSAESSSTAAPALFTRPEGSFAARAFGNAVHAFLEKLAQELAAGQPIAALLANLPSWSPRIAAVLRAEGLPPAQVDRLTQRVLAALAKRAARPRGRMAARSPRRVRQRVRAHRLVRRRRPQQHPSRPPLPRRPRTARARRLLSLDRRLQDRHPRRYRSGRVPRAPSATSTLRSSRPTPAF